jgi:putative ABC transport system substrate-binding protein
MAAARPQQTDRLRRIAVLTGIAANDPETQARHGAFLQALERLGWREGLNVGIEYRWGSGDATNIRNHAAELVSLAPDIILTSGTSSLGPLLQATRTIPIVFVNVADPVGAGFVDSLSQPGGNATGFTQFEYSLSGKWLELLKEIAPGVKRVGVIRDAAQTSGIGQFAVIQSVAPSVGVDVRPINVSDASEIERVVAAFSRSPNGGLVVTSSAFAVRHRELIIALASRHKLPAVYYRRLYARLLCTQLAASAHVSSWHTRQFVAAHADRPESGYLRTRLACSLHSRL